MALTLRQLINAGYDKRFEGHSAFYTACQEIDKAGIDLQGGDYYAAGTHLRNVSDDLGLARHRLFSDVDYDKSFAFYWRDAFYWIDDHWPEEAGEIDMDAILSAMVTATPTQLEYFIGLVDAYRQSIWNKPFNQEFFAALARGFEQWP